MASPFMYIKKKRKEKRKQQQPKKKKKKKDAEAVMRDFPLSNGKERWK